MIILLLVASVWSASPASCSELRFGVQAGLAVSDQDYTFNQPEFSFNPRSSVSATLGLFADLPLTAALSGRLQVLYIRKGSEVKVWNPTLEYLFEPGTVPTQLRDRIDYLSIVPLLKAGRSLGPGRPYLMAGPRLDVKLGGDSELNAIASDGLESITWGATVAVGYEIPLGQWRRLSVEVHYHHDFSDAYDLTRLTVRNRAVVMLIGMTI